MEGRLVLRLVRIKEKDATLKQYSMSLVKFRFARRLWKAWGKHQENKDGTKMITVAAHTIRAKMVGHRFMTMEQKQHAMLETPMDPDNVYVLAVRLSVTICFYLLRR